MPLALTRGRVRRKAFPTSACIHCLYLMCIGLYPTPAFAGASLAQPSPYKGEGIMERTIRPGLATE